MLKHHEFVCPKRARFISIPMEGATSCAMRLAFACGSMDERAEENGIAHFLEHVSFKGTNAHPSAWECSLALESLGASDNASTTEYGTTYELSVLPEHAGEAAEILIETCFAPRFSLDDVEAERDVIIQEIRGGDDEPGDYLWEALKQLMYEGTPLAMPVCGTVESVQAIDFQKLRAYLAWRNQRTAVTLVVAGKIDEDERGLKSFRRILSKPSFWFDDGRLSRQPIALLPQSSARFSFLNKDRSQAGLILAFEMPKTVEPKQRAANRMLQAVLADGMGSRLFQKLREELGLVYGVDASIKMFPGHGFFRVMAEMEPDNVLPTVEAIVRELQSLSCESVSARELRRAREYYWGEASRSLADPETVAQYFANRALLGLPPEDPFAAREAQKLITPADIVESAKEIFRMDRVNLVLAGKLTDSLKQAVQGLPCWR